MLVLPFLQSAAVSPVGTDCQADHCPDSVGWAAE
jgi:hypothetical protein